MGDYLAKILQHQLVGPSGINFYGVGQRATLILVNGRRLAPSGSAGTFADASKIPLSAIDRVLLVARMGFVLPADRETLSST